MVDAAVRDRKDGAAAMKTIRAAMTALLAFAAATSASVQLAVAEEDSAGSATPHSELMPVGVDASGSGPGTTATLGVPPSRQTGASPTCCGSSAPLSRPLLPPTDSGDAVQDAPHWRDPL